MADPSSPEETASRLQAAQQRPQARPRGRRPMGTRYGPGDVLLTTTRLRDIFVGSSRREAVRLPRRTIRVAAALARGALQWIRRLAGKRAVWVHGSYAARVRHPLRRLLDRQGVFFMPGAPRLMRPPPKADHSVGGQPTSGLAPLEASPVWSCRAQQGLLETGI